jgi:hypothetical protein
MWNICMYVCNLADSDEIQGVFLFVFLHGIQVEIDTFKP